MDKVLSGSESDLSIDSLESCNNLKNKALPQRTEERLQVNTASGDANCVCHIENKLFESNQKEPKTSVIECSTTQKSTISLENHLKTYFNTDAKKDKADNLFVFNFYDSNNNLQSRPTQQIKKKTQKQTSLSLENAELYRVRHRSVSYLDQFRKKVGGFNSCGSKDSSNAGSEISDDSFNASFVSTSTRKITVDSSEFECELDNIKRSESKYFNKNKGSKSKASTTKTTFLMPKETQGQDKNHNARNTKPKGDEMDDSYHSSIDKRRFLSKQEEYSRKVNLRNKIEINRQREREKIIKFKDEAQLKSCSNNIEKCFQSCHHQPANDYSEIGKSSSVFCLSNELYCLKCKESTTIERNKNAVNRKTNKCKETTQTLKKEPNSVHLSALKQRHANEKLLVDSFRNVLNKS